MWEVPVQMALMRVPYPQIPRVTIYDSHIFAKIKTGQSIANNKIDKLENKKKQELSICNFYR